MKEIYVPWAKKAVKDALQGLDGADLRRMLTDEELQKVNEVQAILTRCRDILYSHDTYDDGDFLRIDDEGIIDELLRRERG